MAVITRTYFDTPDYTVTYDFDNVALKLLAIHANNRTASNISVQIVRSSDDVVLVTEVMPPSLTDVTLPTNLQQSVVLDARGRITNIYARTA